MNGDLYFEEHPWQRACAQIEAQKLGRPCEIAVQAVCGKGESEACFDAWLKNIRALLQCEIAGDKLACERVISFIAKAGGCVIRIFIDESDGEQCDNFEIVTERALIVWKPGSTLQGRMTGGFTLCSQKYVADLEAKK